MLLDHVGLTEAAAKVEAAVASDLVSRTPGAQDSTPVIGDRLAKLAAG